MFPSLFSSPSCTVTTLDADRTFWEKVTILHALHYSQKTKEHMSRHYYDTYMLHQKGITDDAIKKPDLLERVVKNKSLLFADTRASYDTAQIGSLKLIPDETLLTSLKADYAKMSEMFMGEYPDFDIIVDGLFELEKKINCSG